MGKLKRAYVLFTSGSLFICGFDFADAFIRTRARQRIFDY